MSGIDWIATIGMLSITTCILVRMYLEYRLDVLKVRSGAPGADEQQERKAG